ncbi:cysteine-rich CWC family protein [Vibrio sp.]|nr:cysteine-rich CWC family protein [Vibrio sp.]
MTKTPCIGVCKNVEGICSGCYRTMTEILEWRDYTQERRANIMQQTRSEISTHSCPSCTKPTYCGIADGQTSCWCFDVEVKSCENKKEKTCLCRACLMKLKVK